MAGRAGVTRDELDNYLEDIIDKVEYMKMPLNDIAHLDENEDCHVVLSENDPDKY
ncbi:hypothetical protein ACPUYX_17955 [Desulfosporosinus sp. SYSU MS00001]|uniref:hypothetical protein n=1 Tax=Desulfosporosinus sp. SYSU MS00001 TaxID=3416284 RepID=UPI003CED9C6B